jgi:hypothetical protein
MQRYSKLITLPNLSCYGIWVPIPSPAIGYYILASCFLRILLVSYSELLENLGKTFKLAYAKTLKCIAWPAMG